jgi:hypothetical protein
VLGRACTPVLIFFQAADSEVSYMGHKWPRADGTFHRRVIIPTDAAIGAGTVQASQRHWGFFAGQIRCLPGGPSAIATFTVTSSERDRASA